LKRKGKEYVKGILEYEGEFIYEKRWNGKGYDENLNVIYEIINGSGNNIKIYNSFGELEYEGDYLKGQRNGKGKKYENGGLKYEGEFLNNKRNGIGKEYKNNEIIYEGKFYNDERSGRGKEYYKGEIIFEGDYLKGKRWNGEGKEYYEKRFNEYYPIYNYYLNYQSFNTDYNKDKVYLIYEGGYLYGKRNGKGKEYNYDNGFDNGSLEFEGEFFDGKKWNGIEKNYYPNGTVKMEILYINGQKQKKINIYESNNELIYSGEYSKGEKNGKGKEYYKGKEIFEGEFLKGKRWNGKGSEYFNNGELKFQGEYLNGRKWNGKGYDFKGYEVYQIINGNGYYKEYDGNGNLKYECEYLNGERNGKGKEYYYWNGILKFEGEYLNGKRNGKGKEYDSEGELEYEGEYLNDKRIKKVFEINWNFNYYKKIYINYIN